MSAEKNKAIIRNYFAAISGKEKPASVLDRYISDADAELKQHIAGSEGAFPRYEMIIEDMIAEGDKVVVRALLKATHSGPLGDLPASGRQVQVPFTIIYRLAGGKIVAHWMAFDRLSLMQQLGALPEPAAQ